MYIGTDEEGFIEIVNFLPLTDTLPPGNRVQNERTCGDLVLDNF